ncbi:hypothetical protein [Rufibacter hautae]|uniref:Uncharacterized protein n=1 Tax=Rufibacter hautae TaxID=2595005 RepID=A0A5B6TGV8_9BACT|nr:hypothetical protein [Rufibacter hautae]KAA3439902.1 hypothetical protein FOA19_04310 [Rufibacter hautae]
MEVAALPMLESCPTPVGRCLYVLVFEGDPLLKIGLSTGLSRIKGLRRDYLIDFQNSYLVSSEDKPFLRELEVILLSKSGNFRISKYFQMKYRTGISSFSPSGARELRSSLCLNLVLEEITRQANLSGLATLTVRKGIALTNSANCVGSPGKGIPKERVWFNELHRGLQDILLWIRNPADNQIRNTEGVYLIKRYKRGVLIACDGRASIFAQRLFQFWLHPCRPVNLIEETRDLGNGVYLLIGSGRDIPSEAEIKQIYPEKDWARRFYSWVRYNFSWSLKAVINYSPMGIDINRMEEVEGLSAGQYEVIKSILREDK